jgi:glyoxylase-like metal-dependent hydrolase (beta-lactamase superfamily II)
MADLWDVHVIEFARSKDQPWVDLINGMFQHGTMDLPFSFVLATNGARRVLVDTGFMQGGAGDFSGKFGIPYWRSPVAMLGELGIAPGDITDIVVTHAHFDHMGSIAEFPDARLHIQKAELLSWYEYFALPRQFSYMTSIIDPDTMRTAFDASVEHRVNLIEGDRDNVLPGIHVRFGSGHTPGQQFVIIETARGRLVVSGDCIYSRRNLRGHNDDGVYAPLNNAFGSVLDQLKTMDKMNAELADDYGRLLILHDIERWKGLPVVKEVEGFRIVKAS